MIIEVLTNQSLIRNIPNQDISSYHDVYTFQKYVLSLQKTSFQGFVVFEVLMFEIPASIVPQKPWDVTRDGNQYIMKFDFVHIGSD